MLIDYHLHNHFSPDSHAATPAILARAAKLDLEEICLTNHLEWFGEGLGELGSFDYDKTLTRFQAAHADLLAAAKESPAPRLKFGVEIQYVESWLPDMRRFLKALPFDFVIGSVHLVDGHVISSHVGAPPFLSTVTEEYAYTRYFEDLLKFVAWGDFDVVGHFDIIKKYGTRFYGPFQPQKYQSVISAILKAMAQRGIGLELNTGSLDKACHEIFPHPEILKWALEAGIQHFTLGSDAHSVNKVGAHLPEALALAKDLGIPALTTYEKRRPTLQKIR